MRPPSTDWREVIAPDEAERFGEYAGRLLALQREKARKLGPGRALHRKGLLGLKASLEVLPGLPVQAAHGLFRAAGRFEALVRLSSGSMGVQADRVPDVRGYAVKVLGVQGEAALGGPARSQDFLLINREAFSSPRSDAFMGLVEAAARGPAALVWHFVSTHGPLDGLRRLGAVARSMKRPFTGFVTERFHSAAPIACGPYAARVRLLPASGEADPSARDDWAADVTRRLARGPLTHELQLQFFVDEAVTPIEDASVDWPEAEAPYHTVARLTLTGETADVEALVFDPWSALAEHRPLGDVMRTRKVTYLASQRERGAA